MAPEIKGIGKPRNKIIFLYNFKQLDVILNNLMYFKMKLTPQILGYWNENLAKLTTKYGELKTENSVMS